MGDPTYDPYADYLATIERARQLRTQARTYETLNNRLQTAIRIPDPAEHDAAISAVLDDIRAILPNAKESDFSALTGGGGGDLPGILFSRAQDATRQATSAAQQAYSIAPDLAAQDLPWLNTDDRPKAGQQLVDVNLGGQSFKVSAETAASLAMRGYEHSTLSAGEAARLGQDMYMFNNLSAYQVEQVQMQLRQENRLDETLKFQIDEAQKQRALEMQRIEISRLGVQAQFQGLELQRRGQIVSAISEDFAHQIELGRMEYTEAAQRLNTVDVALTQRRAEREQLLRYAVSRSSLRTNEQGETVTRLPFAEQLVGLLGQSTGQRFDVTQFELPTVNIDPDAAARDVMAAGSFNSPLPALQQNLQAAREAINNTLGAPVGTQIMNEAAIAQAANGI